MRIKFGFRKSDTDSVKGVDAGSAPSPADHDVAEPTLATSAERPANGGTSALLRQAAKKRTAGRHMLWRGGIVSAATVADLSPLAPRRVAYAATGQPFLLGLTSDANASTQLQPTSGTHPSPLFHLNGSALVNGQTTVVVEGAPGTTGIGVTVNAGSAGLAIVTNSQGEASGINAKSTGTGYGVLGNSVTASGVAGTSGSGPGVTGTSNTGPAVAGTISNASSSADAVSGNTAGTGAGVRGTGARGGDFTGTAAAIRLRPASGSHPVSGEAGDLFVDSAGRLFYCRAGGATATWVKLA
jgi:hypothetical protein